MLITGKTHSSWNSFSTSVCFIMILFLFGKEVRIVCLQNCFLLFGSSLIHSQAPTNQEKQSTPVNVPCVCLICYWSECTVVTPQSWPHLCLLSYAEVLVSGPNYQGAKMFPLPVVISVSPWSEDPRRLGKLVCRSVWQQRLSNSTSPKHGCMKERSQKHT